jgi:hypothetical protein
VALSGWPMWGSVREQADIFLLDQDVALFIHYFSFDWSEYKEKAGAKGIYRC